MAGFLPSCAGSCARIIRIKRNRGAKNMRIGIYDSSGPFLAQMEAELKAYMEEKGMPGRVFCFSGLSALLEYLRTEILDLVFLDPGEADGSGIEAAKEINRMLPCCEIAYCSDTFAHAADVYETKHCYYMLKRDMHEILPKVLSKAVDGCLEDKDRISVYSNGGDAVIRTAEILYAERNGKKSYVHLNGGVQIETPERIEVIAQKLIWPQFVRCHNSFIISLDRISTYTRHQLKMEDGREIPVSRPYLVKVRKAFGEWNRRNL